MLRIRLFSIFTIKTSRALAALAPLVPLIVNTLTKVLYHTYFRNNMLLPYYLRTKHTKVKCAIVEVFLDHVVFGCFDRLANRRLYIDTIC